MAFYKGGSDPTVIYFPEIPLKYGEEVKQNGGHSLSPLKPRSILENCFKSKQHFRDNLEPFRACFRGSPRNL